MGTFAFFDIEGTLVSSNTWRSVVKHPAMGAWRVRLAYAEVLPWWWALKLGILSDVRFRGKWVQAMARLFKGMSPAQVADVFDWVAAQVSYHDDVVNRLRQHVADGAHVVLVSGIFTEGAQQIAAHLGAHGGVGTALEYRDGVCTGRPAGQPCVAERKLEFIESYLSGRRMRYNLSDCYAYADSYSDAPLLSAVGHPTAAYPEDALRAVALAQGWTIISAAKGD